MKSGLKLFFYFPQPVKLVRDNKIRTFIEVILKVPVIEVDKQNPQFIKERSKRYNMKYLLLFMEYIQNNDKILKNS